MRSIPFLVVLLLLFQTSCAQLPLPCLHYFEENQISSWYGEMDLECLYINMEENFGHISDDNSRSYLVDEGSIRADITGGFTVVPGNPSNSGFQILLNEDRDNDLDGAWFYPANTYDVELFRKTEWGIKLPTEIQEQVNNWISNDQMGSSLAPTINPFDPEQIDVWAEVWEPGETSYQPVYGFYYRDYERIWKDHNPSNLPDMDDPDNWYWNELPTDYDFRFRFSPKKDGLHLVKLHLDIPGQDAYVSETFTFRTLSGEASRSPLKKSPNGHYFLTSADNQVFFPVGQNLQMPYICDCNKFDVFIDQSQNDLNCSDCYLWENDKCCGLRANKRGNHWQGGTTLLEKTMPLAAYLKFGDVMNFLHANGANTIRTMPWPIAFEIEFEKLNNYFDRQHIAWEFDRVLDQSDDLGMRIEYCMLNHGPLGIGHHADWDWYSFTYQDYWGATVTDGGFCYSKADGQPNIEPTSFLTSVGARAAYKKKLRYVMARFGYACHYTHMELASEINNIGAQDNFSVATTDPALLHYNNQMAALCPNVIDYIHNAFVRPEVENWHAEMANYIKNDLHQTHILLGAQYAGPALKKDDNMSAEPCLVSDGNIDDSYELLEIDVNTFSAYNASPTETYKKYGELSGGQTYWKDLECGKERHDVNNVTLMAESGIDDLPGQLDDTFFYKNLWGNAFGGYGSSGMAWMRPCEDRTEIYQKYSEFVNEALLSKENILDTEDWQPGYLESSESGDIHKYETIFMARKTDGHQHIVGAIFNRTWNPYTMWVPKLGIPNSDFETDEFEEEFDQYLDLPEPLELESDGENLTEFHDVSYENDNAIRFEGMVFGVPYVIRYYNAQTFDDIAVVLLQANWLGRLKLWSFPDLTLTRPIIVYTVDRADYQGLEATGDNNTTIVNEPPSTIRMDDLEEILELEYSDNEQTFVADRQQWRVIKIVNSLGQEIISIAEHDASNLLSTLPLGLYFVVVTNGNEVKTLKLINKHG
jgi:hypothetical protein